MQTSSATQEDPWATTESDGTRHSRAESALGASTSTGAASSGAGDGGGASSGGPLVGRVEQSNWTREDVELMLDILQILALVAAAYAAYEGN